MQPIMPARLSPLNGSTSAPCSLRPRTTAVVQTLPLPAPVCHAPTKLISHKPHPPPPPYTTDALGTPVPPPRQQADHTRPFDTFFILPAYILLIIDGYGELGEGGTWCVEGLDVVLCEVQKIFHSQR